MLGSYVWLVNVHVAIFRHTVLYTYFVPNSHSLIECALANHVRVTTYFMVVIMQSTQERF